MLYAVHFVLQARLEAFQTALSELVVYKSRINVALLQVRAPQLKGLAAVNCGWQSAQCLSLQQPDYVLNAGCTVAGCPVHHVRLSCLTYACCLATSGVCKQAAVHVQQRCGSLHFQQGTAINTKGVSVDSCR
jgi:hypothetical protein